MQRASAVALQMPRQADERKDHRWTRLFGGGVVVGTTLQQRGIGGGGHHHRCHDKRRRRRATWDSGSCEVWETLFKAGLLMFAILVGVAFGFRGPPAGARIPLPRRPTVADRASAGATSSKLGLGLGGKNVTTTDECEPGTSLVTSNWSRDVPLPDVTPASPPSPPSRIYAVSLLPLSSCSSTTQENGPEMAATTTMDVRRVKLSVQKWKDDVLGDGHDYFQPRVQTLRAFNQVLSHQLWQRQTTTLRRSSEQPLQQHQRTRHRQHCQIQAAVLSNCARFDVFVVLQKESRDDEERAAHNATTTNKRIEDDNDDALEEEEENEEQEEEGAWVCRAVAHAVLQQVQLYQRAEAQQQVPWKRWARLAGANQDDPSLIYPVSYDDGKNKANDEALVDPRDVYRLARGCAVRTGPEAVSRYLCLVAAGLPSLAAASSLSSSPVANAATVVAPPLASNFRPFSSRDAHVLLQLKRAWEATPPSFSRLRALFQAALRSGKACRTPAHVPAIQTLRPYSGESSRGRRLGDAPRNLLNEAVQQAFELAVEPAVKSFCDDWAAGDAASAVVALRESVERRIGRSLATTPASARHLVHQATAQVRQGRAIDLPEFLRQLDALLLAGE